MQNNLLCILYHKRKSNLLEYCINPNLRLVNTSTKEDYDNSLEFLEEYKNMGKIIPLYKLDDKIKLRYFLKSIMFLEESGFTRNYGNRAYHRHISSSKKIASKYHTKRNPNKFRCKGLTKKNKLCNNIINPYKSNFCHCHKIPEILDPELWSNKLFNGEASKNLL